MFVLKFKKEFPANLIAHTDLLNIFSRIIKRAKLNVDYSDGFNPHPIIKFSAPMPLGTFSDCEYAFISSSENGEEFVKRFNESSVKGLVALLATDVDKNPNVYFNAEFMELLVQLQISKADAQKLVNYLQEKKASNLLVMECELKGKKFDKNISALLKEAELVLEKDGTISDNVAKFRFVVSCGEDNLRVDRLLFAVCKQLNISYEINSVRKTKQFFKKGFCLSN